MGDRRMISKKVVESARFLKMPATSQNLYFHLVVNADDDGIVEAFPVIALCKSNEDDLKILVAKKFAYVLNEDLVTYIEDWRNQNVLRADRKEDSIYQDLLLSVRPDVEVLPKKQRSDVKKSSRKCLTDSGSSVDGPRTAQYNISQSNIIKDNITQDKSIHLSICDDLGGNDRKRDETESYRKLIADNIGLESLHQIAEKRGSEEVSVVNEIYETICDMVCNPRETVKIKGVEYKWETVRSQYLKLKYTHIANILNKIMDKDLEIKNMNGYLVSTLYTESLSGVTAAESELYDDYLKFMRGQPY